MAAIWKRTSGKSSPASERSSVSMRSFSSTSSLEEDVDVARPPDSASTLASVSASDALEFLDQLVAGNRISQERASRLKRKYNALLESIESSRAAENALLMRSRDLQQQVAKDQAVLEKAEGFPESDSSETTRLRQILLQQQNELMQTEERVGKLEREINKLEDEQHEVQREYDRMPKKEELEERARRIAREIEALKDETDSRAMDVRKMQESIRQKQVAISDIAGEIDELKKAASSQQDKLAEVTLAPVNIPREIDRIGKAKQAAEIEITEQGRLLEELTAELSQLEVHSSARKEEAASLATDHLKQGRINNSLGLAIESMDKNLASSKEREGSLLEEGASLELQLRHRIAEQRMQFEALSIRNREKEKEMKQLKRGDMSLHSLENSMSQLSRQLDAIKVKVAASEAHAKDKKRSYEELKAEVEQWAKSLVEEEGMTEKCQAALEQRLQWEQQLHSQAKQHQCIAAELSHQLVAITLTRDRHAKSYHKALRDQHHVGDALRTKTTQLEDQHKCERELKTRLKEFAQVYELVKTERNKIYAQIQNHHQMGMELKEKLKIMQNEAEILRTSAESKEKVLSKAQQAVVSKLQDRDTQQQELSQLKHHQGDQQSDIDQQREALHKLMQQINGLEQSLTRLRLRYEAAVQDRNDVGLQLIERNEEVCVFHEKINVQDSVVRNGNVDLVQKEEEMRFLKMEVAKLQNEVNTQRHMMPEKQSLEHELEQHHNMLMACRKRLKHLEEEVADASNPKRVRVLPGSDPSCDELRDKTERLQAQLTDCEQQLLERVLLLEQVTRLTDRASKRVEKSRKSTLMVANKVGSNQSRLKEVTHRMMAVVSELSLQQALAMRLQQEVHLKEGKLEQAYARLEAGEPPDQETAHQWLQMQQVRRPLLDEGQEEIAREVSEGVFTTAVPRPNAYLPDGEDDLPVPKPYGSHAPFKPSIPGANMRHIRKPQTMSLDI